MPRNFQLGDKTEVEEYLYSPPFSSPFPAKIFAIAGDQPGCVLRSYFNVCDKKPFTSELLERNIYIGIMCLVVVI